MTEYIQAPFEVKAADNETGIFEALVSVFGNIDRVGDRVMPGAFKDTLADWKTSGKTLPVLFLHQMGNLGAYIGSVLDAWETDEGLMVKAQLDMDDQDGRKAFKLMRSGVLSDFSFSFIADKFKIAADGVRELQRLLIGEVTVAPAGMGINEKTALLSLKATQDEVEKVSEKRADARHERSRKNS